MEIILKSLKTMVKRVADFVRANGKEVGKANRSATYLWEEGTDALSVSYFGENITELVINKTNMFEVREEDVVCIAGDPRTLLFAYELEEAQKVMKKDVE